MSTPSTTGMTSPTASTTSTAGPHVFGIEWNAENRLTAVKQGGSTLASFAYDGEGRRATKTAGGVTTSYVYAGDQFLEERPGAGTPKRYVYGLGIDRPLAQAVGSTTSFFVADHLGSIVQVTDSSGAPTLTREYDPWGTLVQGLSTGGYAFTGREWDAETGLYYYRARYYDPKLARFIAEDPFGFEGGVNLYPYASNAPNLFTDPSGRDVYYLIDHEAAHSQGHSAVIVGQGDCYTYHSFANAKAGKPSGGGAYTEGGPFETLDDARAYARTQFAFDEWAFLEASKGQDEAGRARAREYHSKGYDYVVTGHNCARMAADVSDAAGYSGLNGHPNMSFELLRRAGLVLSSKP